MSVLWRRCSGYAELHIYPERRYADAKYIIREKGGGFQECNILIVKSSASRRQFPVSRRLFGYVNYSKRDRAALYRPILEVLGLDCEPRCC